MSTNTKSPPTSDDELQAALSDLSSLGRVSHRLAMLDDPSRLESVLDKLLSRLLERIGTNHQLQALANIKNNQLLTDTLTKIHQKLVETLSHVMKRVRDDRWVKLNCNSILKLLLISSDGSMPQANPSVNPFTLNLSLAFLTLGVPRCSETDLKQILADLILLHGFYAKKALGSTNVSALSHWHQISHLVVKSLEMIVEYHRQETKNLSKKPKLASASTSFATPSQLLSITAATSNTSSSTPETSGASSMDAIHNVLSKDHAAASALYDLLLDTLLYQNTTGGVPPAGCSQAGQERLQSNKSWVAEMAPPARLSLCKTRLLEWVAPTLQTSLFPENQARTCTLLLVACGDCGSVSTQAELYLKQYLDSEQERNDCTPSEIYLDLIMELLVFCVGSNNALLALSGSDLPALGIAHPQSQHTSIMPFRRRMVSDTTFSVMMSHVYKILSTVPQLFEKSQDQKSMEQVGTLSILAISKMIIKLRTSTGLTALRGKPYVSAAQALNSLVVRFLSTIERAEDQPMDKAGLARIKSLLAKALALACTSLSTTVIGHSSSATTTTISSEGNILVRHALYGIICALSRSTTLVSDPYSWLFAIGKEEDENTVKIDTATLLFSCLANEEQSLLPRATAALDAVLAAYCRITTRKKQVDAVHEEPQHSDNPWSVKNTPNSMSIDTSSESNAMLHEHLARSLLPLLWRASQYNRTKASRLASVRWTSELLKSLDLTNACHLLCFLAGDKDVTVASIARRGLGLGDNDKQNKSQHMDSENESPKLGDFSILTKLLFSNINSSGIWRPNFWEFQPTAKASSIAYLLKCLLNDFYGGDDEAIYLYMDAMTKSLVEVENLGRSYVELLDECAASLSACISTALFARRLIFGTGERCLSLDFGDMEKLAMNISSSCARRDLADACGSIYGDTSLWEKDEWLSSIVRLMETCLGLLEDSRGELGSVHGAAFLGGTCVQHFRLNPNLSIDGNGWTLAGRILSALGRGTTVSDDIVFTESLSVALSFDKGRYADAPPLNSRLQEGATSALSGLAKALRKYSSDEHTDVSRASKVAHSMGICLEATIPFSGGCKKESDELHIVRLLCVDSLLSLLGSPAYRKDEMIALEAGQALAGYAWVPKGLEWEASGSEEWPREIDEEFARSLPPHQQVSQCDVTTYVCVCVCVCKKCSLIIFYT